MFRLRKAQKEDREIVVYTATLRTAFFYRNEILFFLCFEPLGGCDRQIAQMKALAGAITDALFNSGRVFYVQF